MRFALLAAVMCMAAVAACARADSLVVGGQEVACPSALVVESGLILAPILDGLQNLGCKVEREEGNAAITGPRGNKVEISAGEKRITIDGKASAVAAPARVIAGALFVPVQPLAKALGWTLRWQAEARRLAIHGTVTGVKHVALADRQRITISASAPLSCSVGRLKDPERIYVDLLNVDLPGPDISLPVNEDRLLSVRAAQNSVEPDTVRVVLDVEEGAEVTTSPSEAGCTLNVDIPTAGLGGQGQAQATILSAVLGPYREGMAELVVTTTGPVRVAVDNGEDEKGQTQCAITIENVLPGSELPQVSGGHALVKSATLQTGPPAAGGRGTAVLTLTLEGTVPNVVMTEPAGLRVLLGKMALSEMRIVVDAGHGGTQSGAPGRSGLLEKNVNLQVALKLRDLLQERGANALLTRETDDTLVPVAPGSREQLRADLNARAAVANDNDADVFVSIHCNSSNNANSISGTQTYWNTPWSEPLARTMHAALLRKLKRKDAGIHTANFIVLKQAQCPAVLLELAYINNQEEEALLADPRFRQKAAEAAVEGIEEYARSGALLQSQMLKAAAMRAAVSLPSRHKLPERTRRPNAKSRRAGK